MIKNFPGTISTEIDHYSIPTLNKINPDTVILHVGTNDVRMVGGVANKASFIVERELHVLVTVKIVVLKILFLDSCRKNDVENKLVSDINKLVQSLCEDACVSHHNTTTTFERLVTFK